LNFELPEALVAREPSEARGLPRDGVRLLVSRIARDNLEHARFSELPRYLAAGDLLVANASATLSAALEASREHVDPPAGDALLHLSTPLAGNRWVVELRRRIRFGHEPLLDASPGERLRLPGGGGARLLEPYGRRDGPFEPGRVRLWVAELALPASVHEYTSLHGSPIRYAYVPGRWPLSMYQTVFSAVPGSAEMPSAGRPFTPELLERLEQDGVRVATLVLHTGVSSLDADEPPYAERFLVPAATAGAVNRARAAGGRVLAVGTTSVRALETVADEAGFVRAGEGWTDLVVTPERGVRVVDGILTGLHGPSASHLSMLEALAGREHIAQAYEAAVRHRYLWHEFGDAHLILP
jgi:S-adenosylmethionine:tRNA ribosyltransferase-isomerase